MPFLMLIAFAISGIAVLVQVHAVQQAHSVAVEISQADVQVLPPDSPIAKALAQATKAAAAIPPTAEESQPEEATDTPELLPFPVNAPYPVLPPIIVIIPPLASAPAPAPTTTPPAIINNVPTQPAYMPKAPDITLSVNGQSVDTLTVSAGDVLQFDWLIQGETSNVKMIEKEEGSDAVSTIVTEEGKREITVEKSFVFAIKAVGTQSGLGADKTIIITVQ